jgi:hypothetical protein
MISSYYRERGLEPTGMPTVATLGELDLAALDRDSGQTCAGPGFWTNESEDRRLN